MTSTSVTRSGCGRRPCSGTPGSRRRPSAPPCPGGFGGHLAREGDPGSGRCKNRPMAEPIQFFFDPMCPYAYQTSVWIRDVRGRIGLDITWRFFSLEEVNRVEGKKHPWERPWSFGWGQMRVGVAHPPRPRQRRARPLVRGRRLGVLQRRREDARARGARGGACARTASTRRSSSARSTIRPRSTTSAPTTTRAAAAYGAHGVPTIVLASGYAVYGPVVVPAPDRRRRGRALGARAHRWQRFPHLYELRHPKTHDDLVHVAQEFRTYLTTRDWNTVENPAP